MLKVFAWIVGAFVVFMIVGTIIGSSPEAQQRQKERDAIAFCWTEQARKSNTPAQARFVAGACELMERQFREKHGLSP
jgi:quinol-cytochrome oxidoreductase complex cytochrome b subunit